MLVTLLTIISGSVRSTTTLYATTGSVRPSVRRSVCPRSLKMPISRKRANSCF